MNASGQWRLRRQGPIRRRIGSRATRHLGVAAVELALCLPVICILAFGMIETCNMMFLRTRMISACYEAARYGTRPTTSSAMQATNSQVSTYCSTLLTQLGVNGATVTVTPSNLSSAVPQTQVTVTATAPLSQNAVTSFVVPGSTSIVGQATLIME
jgi:Flp pilus assembly protein TadG